jgi:carboxyl-terminal processing protease
MHLKKTGRFFIFLVFLILLTGSWAGYAALQEHPDDLEPIRTRLLAHLIYRQMESNHFSHKPLDDQLSEAAFQLYLQQLDYQKRFLLAEDVEQLRRFADRIDDQMIKGDLQLPATAARLLRLRIAAVSDMVARILEGDFDFNIPEKLETDPEKLDYCRDMDMLRQRWRLILKYQVLMRYVQLLEERDSKTPGAASDASGKQTSRPDEKLLRTATEKVRNSSMHLFSRLLEQSEREHLERFFNAFTRAYDPHSSYLAPETMEDFEIYMKGSLEGIGATLREEDGFIRVVEIIPGSPAAKQGHLEAEDIILKVGEGAREPVDITETRLRDAVRLIRGEKGTEVRLTVRKPDGSELVVPIIRDVVEIEEGFAKSTVVPLPGPPERKYGYLQIPSFYRDFKGTRQGREARNVTDDVRRELLALRKEGIAGLVLDLRDNGGGALTDAISVAGLFISTGPVVQVKNSDGQITVFEDQDPETLYDGPLVVLINRFSASASEILAGAIQDYGRGVIIGGDTTHGKGTVQAIFELDQPMIYGPLEALKPLGAMKVTIQKFYRVSGESTQARGVVPDIQLPDRLAFLETGEQFSDFALPWDTVDAVPHQQWPKHPDLAALNLRSRSRVAEGHRFDEVVAETRQNSERSQNTARSLEIADVLADRASLRRALGLDKPKEKISDKPASDQDRPSFQKEVAEDPYIGEAMAVLSDMLKGASVAHSPITEEVANAARP